MVCVDAICATVFPLASNTLVLTVTDFAAPESFTTSVFTFTGPNFFETRGVVTKEHYHTSR